MRVVSGADRAQVRFGIRTQPDPSNAVGYAVLFQPGRGVARFIRQSAATGEITVMAERTDLAGLFAPDTWNGLAVRAQGPNLWLLLNDQPILSATDSTYDTGRVLLALIRLGDPNDSQEVAAVPRNLRVSGLASEDLAAARPASSADRSPSADAEHRATCPGRRAQRPGGRAGERARPVAPAQGSEMTKGGWRVHPSLLAARPGANPCDRSRIMLSRNAHRTARLWPEARWCP